MPADDVRQETAPLPPGRRPLFTKIAILVLTVFLACFLLIVNEVLNLPDQTYWIMKAVLIVLSGIAVVTVLLITRDLAKPWGTRKSTRGG
jgi:hypothetical protein